jgi:hypothetical protein
MADKDFKVKSNLVVGGLTTAGPIVRHTDGTLTSHTSLPIDKGGTGQTSATNALNALLPVQTSANGQYLKSDGTNSSWSSLPTPSFVQMTTVSVSSNITLDVNKRYFVDTSSARTLTLPASPSDGDEIQIFDIIGSAATNKITVDSNSNKINGTVQDLEIDIDHDAFSLIYTGSGYGWSVI